MMSQKADKWLDQTDPAGWRERVEEFAALSDAWFWETDRQHRFVFVTDSIERIAGVLPKDCLGRTREELAHNTGTEAFARNIADIRAHRPFEKYIYQTRRELGSRWVQISGHPIFGPDAEFLGYRGVGRDITELQEQRISAERAENWLDSALKSISQGFLMYDADDRLVLCNDTMRSWFDPDRDRIELGMTFDEIMTEIARYNILKLDARALAEFRMGRGRNRRSGENRGEFKTTDGRYFDVIEYRRPDGCIAIYSDITSRKRAEKKTLERTDMFSTLIENLPMGICTLDRNKNVEFANGRFPELLQLPESSLVPGTPVSVLFDHMRERGDYADEQDLATARDFFERVQAGKSVRIDNRKVGGRHLDIRVDPLERGGAVATVTDMTAWKRMHAAVQEREERYRSLVERSPDGIIVHDRGVIRFANAAMARMVGAADASGVVGLKVEEICTPESMVLMRERGRMMREGLTPYLDERFTITGRRLDGTEMQAEVEGSMVTFDQREMVQVVIRDVTSQVEAAVTLRKAKEAAEFANRAKSQFLANMSHELRTPLNAIIGFSELIEQELFGPVGDPRYAEYLKDIHDSGTHLLSLINDILDLSKAEAGQMELHEQEVDLNQLIEGCARIVRSKAFEHGITLLNKVEADGDLSIEADARLLKQIMINLLSNAIKFSESGGKVEISASQVGDQLQIVVRDWGQGIARNDLGRIFEPFVQGDFGLDKRHEGTGLGLSLSRSLAELHGGTLHLESEPGVGTRAILSLPADRVLTQGG